MKKILLFILLFSNISHILLAEQTQPNILWISAEDMSPVLGCYGDQDAITPNIDAFAKESTLFTHAFATAPVCSPSRSCLIQGVSAPTQGTHQMRSAFPIPQHWLGFPTLLRKAGYYTSNNVKTDYNTGHAKKIISSSWCESSAQAHWRNRPKGKPFFSVFNLMTSHQSRSMVWPYEDFIKNVQSKISKDSIHNPNKISLPSYYPDTPIVRREHARFYDCVTAMDLEVGQILNQLKQDGLDQNTIVFFFSDHGSGMPRHKRSLFDSGLKVPLIVHIPDAYKHLIGQPYPNTSDKMISFIDYAPTVLELAGIKVPDYMEGHNFLSDEFASTYVFGHRDRVDEVIDVARSVRNKRYLYIRNYMPHLSHFQASGWPDLGKIREDFKKASEHWKELPNAQKQFLAPHRPIEELYDCEADPINIHNLIDSKSHQAILKELKKALKEHLLETHDLGFLSEVYQWELSQIGRAKISHHDYKLILESAENVGKAKEQKLIAGLQHPHPAVRNWNAIGLRAKSQLSAKATSALLKSLSDPDESTQINAAFALVYHQNHSLGLKTLERHLSNPKYPTALVAARTVEILGDKVKNLKSAMQSLDRRCEDLQSQDATALNITSADKDTALFIRFSTQAFLNSLN